MCTQEEARTIAIDSGVIFKYNHMDSGTQIGYYPARWDSSAEHCTALGMKAGILPVYPVRRYKC